MTAETRKNKRPGPAAQANGGGGKRKRELIYAADGKIAGHLGPGNVWMKNAQGSRHFMKQPPAISFDAGAYDRLKAEGRLLGMRVFDTETAVSYSIALDTFEQHKGELERGYGRQYFCRISHFTRKEAQTQIPVIEPGRMPPKGALVAQVRGAMQKRKAEENESGSGPAPEPKPEQYTLFDMEGGPA